MKAKKSILTALLTSLLTLAPTSVVWAITEDEDIMSYDEIISELSRGSGKSRTQSPRLQKDPLASVLLHGGVGLVNTLATIKHPDGGKTFMNQRGVQAAFGIDLLSDKWLAEGGFRNFGQASYSLTQVSLKEFDIRLIYRTRLSQALGLRFGGGMTARYLSIQRPGGETVDYTTPASVALMGLDLFVSDKVSFGTEVSSRNTMIDETADRNSLDVTLRVDTHF